MAMAQLKWVDADSNVTPDSGVTVGSSSIRHGRPAGARARRRRPSRRCSRWPRRASASPSRASSVKDGVVSGGGKTVTYGAADRRQALQRPDGRRDAQPGPVAGQAARPVHARRHEPAADRHPGQGHRQVHLRPERPGRPACCTPASCGRAARPRTASAPKVLSVDESSIKHIPDVQVVREEQLHRASLRRRSTTRSRRRRSSR